MYKFANNRELSDVEFYFPLEKQTIFAHKVILSARSKYFEKIFSGEKQEKVLVLDNASYKETLICLEYIYTGRLKLPSSFNSLSKLYDVASTFSLFPVLEELKSSKSKQKNSLNDLIWTDFSKIFHNNLHSDVILQFKDKNVFAHRIFLASSSNFFRSMFNYNWKENTQREVKLDTWPAFDFEKILEFIYTNKTNISSIKSVLNLISLGQYFQVNSFVEYCEDYLSSVEIDKDNVCTLWNASVELQTDSLTSFCKEFFVEHFSKCVQTEDFLNLKKELLISALSNGELSETDEHILEALRKWTKNNVEVLLEEKITLNEDQIEAFVENFLCQNFLPPKTLFNKRIKSILIEPKRVSIYSLII